MRSFLNYWKFLEIKLAIEFKKIIKIILDIWEEILLDLGNKIRT